VIRRAATALAVLLTLVAAPAVAQATPGPSSAPEYWFDSWQVPQLWSSGARGQGVTIAEIDTGVSVVPELAGRVLRGKDFGSLGGDGQADRETNAFGHGTAMASIMVARPGAFSITGLAPAAKILPLAVPLAGTSEAGQPDRLADAIRYAAAHGAKIINMSLGGKRTARDGGRACTADEQQAVLYALAKGAVLTAAVGNAGPTQNTVEDPAVCLGVVAVGAVDATGAVARFSSRLPYVTLVAPGVDVPSLGRVAGNAYSGDGTSQATAITSAALALVWSKYPRLTGCQVVGRILATLASRRSKPNAAYGYGLLDAGRAVRSSVPADAPNPVCAAVSPFLERYRAVHAAKAAAPKPAATRAGLGAGRYSVGSIPRLTAPQVLTGAGLGLGGLALLLVTAGTGLLRRRRRAGPTPVVDPPAGPGEDDLPPVD